MKIIIKLFGIFLLLNILILSSCKKELGCTDVNAFNYDPDAEKDDDSCEDIILGCMDNSMINYNPSANTGDGSCLSAYEAAQGIWNINPDCQEIEIPLFGSISLDDQLPESIDVQSGDTSLFIDIDGTQISGSIDNNGYISVSLQTVNIDPGFGTSIPVNVDGTGKIESQISGYMDLTYSFAFGGLPLSTNCHIVLSK